MSSHDVLQHYAHGGKRRYRCPECGAQNVRLLATGKFTVDISDQPTGSYHFDHNLDAFGDRIDEAWAINSFGFFCVECDHESRSWHTKSDALTTAVEWSEVKE